jgi:anti-sigma B factor antagonist
VIKPSRFEIKREHRAGQDRLLIAGELDMASAERLDDTIGALVRQGTRELVLDLSGLSFVDSSGLRLLLLLNDRAAADGWRLALVRPPDEAFVIFRVTGADRHLPFTDD